MFSLFVLVLNLLRLCNALSKVPRDLDWGVTPGSIVRNISLVVSNEVIHPDGFARVATLANGTFPGPLIWANKGDRLSVTVYNNLSDESMYLGTSIHWHGIFQQGTNWADGVASVTQCLIGPQQALDYKFDLGDQSGTYWYHSHYSTQYCDGLRGPLVIHDPDDPLQYLYDVDDASTVLPLDDWYHSPSAELGEIEGPVIPDSTLVGGAGRYEGGPPVPLKVIEVLSGLRYRFRVLNMGCHAAFNFSIDRHLLLIIEADGIEVDPFYVDSVTILAGQRYSVVVTANQPIDNYWVLAKSNLKPNDEGHSAILHYVEAPEQYPTDVPGTYEYGPLNETDLHPLYDPKAPRLPEPGNANVDLELRMGFNINTGKFTINNVSFDMPEVPVLLQILNGVPVWDVMPNGSIYEIPLYKCVQVIFEDVGLAPGGPHPMHLHGQGFGVLRSADAYGNELNYFNPVRRDVVSIGDGSVDVAIGFCADNPGPWILHCHIDWHLNLGFAVVFTTGEKETAQLQTSDGWKALCQNKTYTPGPGY